MIGVDSLLGALGNVLERVIPDPAARAQATQKLAELEQSGDLAVIAGQVELDKVEAANSNIFISGWRPFVGWVCGAGLSVAFLIGPIFTWASNLLGHPTPFPQLEMGTMLELLAGMLGMAGLRTYEKLNNVEHRR